jgi:membrane protein required for beta-lactamase induction
MTAAGDRRGGDALAQAFEALRPRLVRVAYATVGSVAEAEDCVQEAWLLSVISFTGDGGRIAAIDVVRNPDKLTGVREPG